jgi:hypothetical protein
MKPRSAVAIAVPKSERLPHATPPAPRVNAWMDDITQLLRKPPPRLGQTRLVRG